jgi:hypothetical protein
MSTIFSQVIQPALQVLEQQGFKIGGDEQDPWVLVPTQLGVYPCSLQVDDEDQQLVVCLPLCRVPADRLAAVAVLLSRLNWQCTYSKFCLLGVEQPPAILVVERYEDLELARDPVESAVRAFRRIASVADHALPEILRILLTGQDVQQDGRRVPGNTPGTRTPGHASGVPAASDA